MPLKGELKPKYKHKKHTPITTSNISRKILENINENIPELKQGDVVINIISIDLGYVGPDSKKTYESLFGDCEGD